MVNKEAKMQVYFHKAVLNLGASRRAKLHPIFEVRA